MVMPWMAMSIRRDFGRFISSTIGASMPGPTVIVPGHADRLDGLQFREAALRVVVLGNDVVRGLRRRRHGDEGRQREPNEQSSYHRGLLGRCCHRTRRRRRRHGGSQDSLDDTPGHRVTPPPMNPRALRFPALDGERREVHEGLVFRAASPCAAVAALLQTKPSRGCAVPRNAEVIRQWNMLRSIEAAHYGLTVQDLTEAAGRVQADDLPGPRSPCRRPGFPLIDETRDNHTYWTLNTHPFRHLTQLGFSLSELCALYLSRRLVESLTGIPFQAALGDAFGKFEREITPKMKAYLDCLPSVMSARPTGGKVSLSPAHNRMIEQLVDASVARRQVRMLYYSLSHERKAEYLVYPAPVRLHARRDVPARLGAGPPAGADVRGPADPAGHGARGTVRSGPGMVGRHVLPVARARTTAPRCTWSCTSSVTLAPIIAERQYHKSQRTTPRPDGSTHAGAGRVRRRVAAQLRAAVRPPGPGGRARDPRARRSAKNSNAPGGTTRRPTRSSRWPPRRRCSTCRTSGACPSDPG